ncbi:MAG: hypothetical protein ABIP45_08420 [Knoellia sp.]
MTFHDLPDNFRDLPLDDSILRADAVDLFVSYADRDLGCLALIALDEQHRVTAPIVITEMGAGQPDGIRHALRTIGAQLELRGLVAAIGRHGSPLFTDNDRACHQAIVDVCRELGVDLLGTYIALGSGVRELPDHLRMAS